VLKSACDAPGLFHARGCWQPETISANATDIGALAENISLTRYVYGSARAPRRLLALGSGSNTGVPARLAFRAVLATLLWLLRELDPLRRRGRFALLVGPRRVISGKSRHAEQRHDQSQHSHGVPQDGRSRLRAYRVERDEQEKKFRVINHW
jgi:hypothetical protein